jgi:hypothetical protein
VETAVDNLSLFVHSLGFSRRDNIRKVEKVLSGDAIIHKDVENVLIPCVSDVSTASTRELSFPDSDA